MLGEGDLELRKTKWNSSFIFATSQLDAVNDLVKKVSFPMEQNTRLPHSSEKSQEGTLGRQLLPTPPEVRQQSTAAPSLPSKCYTFLMASAKPAPHKGRKPGLLTSVRKTAIPYPESEHFSHSPLLPAQQ